MASTPQTDAPPTASSAYRLLTVLGEGATGVVHLAVRPGPGDFKKLAVLKLLRAELLFDEQTRGMFLEEARICARLAHPNLVTVFEITEHERKPAIVMEYLDGRPLSDIPGDEVPRLPQPLHLLALSQALAGLHAAHELRDFDGSPMELVHRDLSPHNIFVLFDGQVKLLDFGIAKARRSTVHTETGLLKGKVRHMAPEQLVGGELDRRADVFAMGILLHEALCGEPLWTGYKDKDVLRCLANGEIPALPHDPDSAIDPRLAQLRNHALATEPDERLPTAAALRAGIEDYLQSLPTRPTTDELARFLAEHFGGARHRLRADIETKIRQLPQPAEQQTTPDTATDEPATSERTEPAPGQRPRRAITLATVGLALVGIAGIVVTQTSPQRLVAPRCPANTKLCRDQCVALDRPDHGCGDEDSCTPCDISNATPRCDAQAACAIAICHQGFEDCDGDLSNGCEIDTRTDPAHCGGCSQACPPRPHALPGCGDICTIWRCEDGFRDCNGLVPDGCEVAVDENPEHCGHCDVACSDDEICIEGTCRAS